jgi:hypothetical protein
MLDLCEIDCSFKQPISCIASHIVNRHLQHNKTYTTHVLAAGLRPGVDATGEGCSAIVVEVVVERTVASAKLLFLEEERII